MNTTKKIISIATTVSLLLMTGGTVFGQTAAELQEQINSLLSTLSALQSQLTTLQGGTPATGTPAACSGITFTRTLKQGSTGSDVKCLQALLNQSADTKVSATGAGSPGNETSTFGAKTKAAVIKFQEKYASEVLTPLGLTVGTGNVGPATRTKLNAMLTIATPTPTATATPTPTTSGNPTPTPIVGTGLTVAAASDNPAAAVVAGGTAFNPAVKTSFTAGSDGQVKVTSITVTKSGFSANTVFSGIDVVDKDGKRHGNVISSINADNTATLALSSDPIIVPAGGTNSALVRFNITTSATSGTVQFAVTAITTDGATVTGLPVNGNAMSIVSGTSNIATVTVDVMALNATGINLNVNPDSAQQITKYSIAETSSNEDIKLQSLTLFNNGTAADTDYKDVELVAPDGTSLATAQPASKYVTFTLGANAYTIGKGLTKNFTVRAKIINGTSRTIQFVIYNDYDVQVRGASSGALVLPTAAGNVDSTFPIGNTTTSYNTVTIASGTITFNKASDSPSAGVAPGAQSIVLAKYNIKPNGEDMELRGLSLYIKKVTTTPSGSVFVKLNDSTVWSGAATTTGLVGTTALGSATLVALSLSSYPVMTAGQTGTLTVVINVSSSAISTDNYQGRLQVTSVKRLVTNDIDTAAADLGSATNGNLINVSGLNLAVTNLSVPVAASVVAGSTGVELARASLDASNSGEDIKVSTVKFTDTKSATAAYTDIANLLVYDAANPTVALQTTSSTSTNANSNTFTFSSPILATRTAIKTLILKGDVVADSAGDGTGTHTYKVNATTDVTAVGATTGNTATVGTPSGSGQTMTLVSSGHLTVSLLSGTGKSPSTNQNVTIGTQGQVYFAFKLTSQFEALKVTSLKLTATNSDGNLSIRDLSNIGLYADNAGQPAASPFASTSQLGSDLTYTWTATDNLLPAAVQPGAPATFYAKADISPEGTAALGDDFKFEFAAPNTDIAVKGAYTGTTGTVDTSSVVAAGGLTYIQPFNVAIEGSFPTAGSSTTTAVGAGTALARFKITNNGSAQITLTNVKFYDSGSHTGTGTRYQLFASSENASDYGTNQLSTTSADEVSHVLDFGALTASGSDIGSITINGGAYRILTVQISTAGTIGTNDTFNFSVASFGDLKYSATEANLGYSADRTGTSNGPNTTLSDTISSLRVNGTPANGTLVKSA